MPRAVPKGKENNLKHPITRAVVTHGLPIAVSLRLQSWRDHKEDNPANGYYLYKRDKPFQKCYFLDLRFPKPVIKGKEEGDEGGDQN